MGFLALRFGLCSPTEQMGSPYTSQESASADPSHPESGSTKRRVGARLKWVLGWVVLIDISIPKSRKITMDRFMSGGIFSPPVDRFPHPIPWSSFRGTYFSRPLGGPHQETEFSVPYSSFDAVTELRVNSYRRHQSAGGFNSPAAGK